MQPLRWLLVGLLMISLFACTLKNNGKSVDLGNGGGGVDTPTPGSTQSANDRAVLKVGTVWEKMDAPCTGLNVPYFEGDTATQNSSACDTATTPHKTCNISSSTPVGVENVCDVEIPEGQLYFSSIRFELKINSKECAQVIWRPYFYRASNQAGFTPAWNSGSPIDCSGATTLSADCFNGPAKYIATNFPTYTGIYYVFGNKAGTWNNLVPVANEKSPGNSNRFASNNLAANKRDCNDPASGLPMGDGYVCDSMHDYQFICADEYQLQRFSFRIHIYDKNDSGLAAALGLSENQTESWAEYAN